MAALLPRPPWTLRADPPADPPWPQSKTEFWEMDTSSEDWLRGWLGLNGMVDGSSLVGCFILNIVCIIFYWCIDVIIRRCLLLSYSFDSFSGSHHGWILSFWPGGGSPVWAVWAVARSLA